MAEFDALIEAQLAGAAVRVAPLVHFDFRSGARRVWPGFGPLVAAGHTWQGMGDLGSISQISAGPGGSVEEVTLSLHFTSEEILLHLDADSEDSIDREVEVWLQFFDARGSNWRPLDDPLQLFWGRMGPLEVDRSPGDPPARVISVRAQNAFINRARPVLAFFSDRDQKTRSGDGLDNLCIRVSTYSEGSVAWPSFNSV